MKHVPHGKTIILATALCGVLACLSSCGEPVVLPPVVVEQPAPDLGPIERSVATLSQRIADLSTRHDADVQQVRELSMRIDGILAAHLREPKPVAAVAPSPIDLSPLVAAIDRLTKAVVISKAKPVAVVEPTPGLLIKPKAKPEPKPIPVPEPPRRYLRCYTARWCGWCVAMKSRWQEIKADGGDVEIIDLDTIPEGQWRPKTIPLTQLVVGETVSEEWSGVVGKQPLADALKKP
jgi:hypothetical protein